MLEYASICHRPAQDGRDTFGLPDGRVHTYMKYPKNTHYEPYE